MSAVLGYEGCIGIIQAAAGRELSEPEMIDLLSSLQARQRYLQARGMAADAREAAVKAAEQVASEIEVAAIVEKRNAALNAAKRLELVARIQSSFGNNIAEGLESVLVGVNRAKVGAKEGVAQVQEALRGKYIGGFVADLERSGHKALFTSGAMDREVANALWALGKNDTAQLGKLSKEAVDLARVLGKWQEATRLEANAAGAAIGKEEGYITRQSHDAERIRGDGSAQAFEAWRQVAMQRFDLDRMAAEQGIATPAGMASMLRNMWTNLASGNHLKAAPEEVSKAGFKGSANLAKKVSQERVIHFKTADDWFEYNQQFGNGNLRESIVAGLKHSADSTGLMQVLGTNPAAMFETVKTDLVEAAKASGNVEMVAKLTDKEKALSNYMAAVDGSMNVPGNATWARRAANVRSWEMLSKLGGMVLSQLNDLGVYASGARYQGRSFMSGMHEAVSGLGRNLSNEETRHLVASLGVVLDNAAGELGRVGSFGEAGGMAKASQLFMKLNGSQWWTNHMRSSAAMGMSHHLALVADRTFDRLSPDFQRVLSTYGITAPEWNVLRQTAAKNVDGKAYIVPEAIHDITDDAVKGYVGQAASPAAIKDAKAELETKLRNYISDQTSTLALEPGAKTRAMLLQGTRPGTVPGELMRFMMQFKSFTGAYMQRVVGRELYGRGYEGDSLWGALTHGNGEAMGLAQLIVTSTLMGYASMSLKDLAKGRTPRDPTESGADAAKIMLAAMVQGGGAGIYGDFLFGQANRTGSGTIESLGGPVISGAGRVIDLYHRALAGDDVAARTFNEALNNTPFMNLFYARQALNYMVLYRMQESLNPGFLQRMERQAEQSNAHGFLLRPSEVVQ
jgi:hypothetical protein